MSAILKSPCRKQVARKPANPLLDAALDLAERGFSVLPLHPRSKIPAMRRCYEKATADQEKIRDWWEREPDLNIGVVPAARGLCVIDVDGALGNESLRKLEALLGKLPSPTVSVFTPNSGWHLYFKCDERFPSYNGVASGIDIRSAGGHCVVPPSRLLDGDYLFAPGLSLAEIEPAILPDLWVKFFALPRGGGDDY